MGEVSVKQALSSLSSDRQKDRIDGLSDLKHILLQNKNSRGLEALNDKGYYNIFQSLFRFVAIEKSLYLRSSTRHVTRAQVTNRLETCASVLRITTEVSAQTIRLKTFLAVVYHITDSLSSSDIGLSEPLKGDYIRALHNLLKWPPHVEHLSKHDWTHIIDFCLESLGFGDEESPSQLSLRTSQRLPSEPPSETRSRSLSREPAARQRVQHGTAERGNNAGEFEQCIQLLVASPSSALPQEAPKLLSGLVGYLGSLNAVGSTPHAAFVALNTVLSRAMTNCVSLVQDIMLKLIPIIRKFWTSKSPALKEEMLITLFIGKDALVSLSQSPASTSFIESLEKLVGQLRHSYLKLPDKDSLQLDDVVFTSPSIESPLSTGFLGPRPGVIRSMINWATLWAISGLSGLLDDFDADSNEAAISPDGAQNKRPRLASRIEDIYRDASSSFGASRIYSLQLLPFILSDKEPEIERFSSLLHQLSSYILDENTVLASWIMIALSSLARCPNALSAELKSIWLQVWELTSRAIASPGTARAACNLGVALLRTEILDYPTVAQNLGSILASVDLNGPPVLSDSALTFWATVADLRSKANPAQSQETAKQICAWLRSTWAMGSVTDRHHAAQIAAFARPVELLNLFMASTGRASNPLGFPIYGPLCRLSKIWFTFRENRELVEYLLLIQPRKHSTSIDQTQGYSNSLTRSTRPHPGDAAVLELLQSKIDGFSQLWTSLSADKSHQVTAELVQILSSMCMAAYIFIEAVPQLAHRSQELQASTERLWNSICDFLSQHEAKLLHSCIDVLSPFILSLYPPFSLDNAVLNAVHKAGPALNAVLESRRSSGCGPSYPQDIMDIDDEFAERGSRLFETDTVLRTNRLDSNKPLFEDSDSLCRAVTIQLSLLTRVGTSAGQDVSSQADPFVEYIATLKEPDILVGWHYITRFLATEPQVARSSADRMLEHVGELCLQSYELERCEASTSACVSLITCFTPLWISDEQDELAESASDLYGWFIDVLIGEGIGSSKTLIKVAALLEHLINASMTIPGDNSRPSPRTSLFKILSDGDLAVKFNVSRMIPSIFGRFILKEHDAIFGDILENLPRDPDWHEGIALRLYLLSQLASQWHTLLRRSIYHIFEAPGGVPQSAPYAKFCLQQVANALDLSDPKEAFRLFSSQILYTWMESEDLPSVPYSVFGYSTLKELLLDVQDEAVAQIIMRVKEEDMNEISSGIGTPFEDLLALSFYKAEAYSVARDISLPPSQDQGSNGAENTIKRLLGTAKFFDLVERSFPEIIATLFRCIDQTEQIKKAFEKRPAFHPALKIWLDIEGKGASEAILPAGQQPSFRARYFLDELEFVCGRLSLQLEEIWTPTLYCFVARSLLETIHPALGSLHACSVLRKLRVLLCIAGPIALRGYQLEMLLHSLRSYITDFHCSEDAIGLFWYLIENGSEYLSENPSFVAGLGVSTLASLREFLSSSQDSTTQESQFRATLSQAQAFHQWLSSFLDSYVPSDLDESSKESLRKIFQASQNVQLIGSAKHGTYEGDLMSELLRDKANGGSLLGKHAQDLVFSFLCKRFERPLDFREDILGEDKAAADNTLTLWRSLQNRSCSPQYRLWIGRALGRSYAATGVISDSLLREQPAAFAELPKLGSHVASKFAILSTLCDLLVSANCRTAGLVERALQVIVNKLSGHPDLEECLLAISPSLMDALVWAPYQCPEIPLRQWDQPLLEYTLCWDPKITASEWARNIALALCSNASTDPVIGSLKVLLLSMPSLSTQLLPYILHDVLLTEVDGNQMTSHTISHVFQDAFQDARGSTLQHVRLIIHCILYLRYRELPHESTMNERDGWLEIDFLQASSAAIECGMNKTALLFVEIHSSRVAASSRRSSVSKNPLPPDLLHDIFRNIDDPDFFYGVQQRASLDSIMSRFQHEESGLKNLFFQSANNDADLKLGRVTDDTNTLRTIDALNSTNLQGIASVMLNSSTPSSGKASTFDGVLSTALYLQQWDIPVPPASSATGNLFKSLQSLNNLEDKVHIIQTLDDCVLGLLDCLSDENQSLSSLRASMRTLGILAEVDEVMVSHSADQVKESWQRIQQRGSWLKFERFDDISQILHSHEALWSLVSRKSPLKSMLGLSSHDARLLEVEAMRQSLKINRDHNVLQGSLKSAMLLSKLVESSASLGVTIDAAATFDLANVLWDQGEMTASIRMLEPLVNQPALQKQSIAVNRAEVLASLGHHIAEARLEKPDTIIQKYLSPAVKELKGNLHGEEAGHVFHEFARFCDQQLQNPDMLEDFRRVEQLRDRKQEEVSELDQMMKSAEGRERDQLRSYGNRAKQWFQLDDREYQRLKGSRESFLEKCLENYLQSLMACDTFNRSVLRFCALWLDNSDHEASNAIVSKHLADIPSRKFASLMNQLSSRLLDVDDDFQKLLSNLIYRICIEHPYHGMYQLFASSKSKGGKDDTAMSRFRAAGKLVDQVKNHPTRGPTWVAVHNTNISYVRFAMDRLDGKVKSGSKIPLRKSVTGQRLEQDVTRQKIPPPIMKIELRVDCDYSQVPRLTKFQPEFTVASGVSAPKIVTAIASDGEQYKQLFKGGNDDLRQDSIMEQVFEQVSDLLRDHRETQRRGLGIRTYKVLPLTANAGIIEFVQNTIPLHEYLLPAHQKHFPNDFKPNVCRKHISDAQSKTVDQRVKVFRQVTDRFHPVLRYFFMERFLSPDDWFSKRLAYTRSTAAISIMGYILGLGDRHGHNILLDSKTGEVVHIDLGVAFEQGRVLPVPEVVPFRLTRDLVDGMGVTKTEGVFRRCCEFTLEALREESYSIMTMLDVLRYDPLYSWSLSPVRMKKMQDTQDAAGGADALKTNGKRKAVNEPSEADRALTVVAKKLGKTLSVSATVNELIQQATDERNLAVLYCGWAAYA